MNSNTSGGMFSYMQQPKSCGTLGAAQQKVLSAASVRSKSTLLPCSNLSGQPRLSSLAADRVCTLDSHSFHTGPDCGGPRKGAPNVASRSRSTLGSVVPDPTRTLNPTERKPTAPAPCPNRLRPRQAGVARRQRVEMRSEAGVSKRSYKAAPSGRRQPPTRWQRMAMDARDATHHHFGSSFSGPLVLCSRCRGRPASPQCLAPKKSPEA